MVFSSPIFPANITLQPLSGLMLSAKFYLNTSFCLVLHNTLWSVHLINFQPIFTDTPSPSPMVPFSPITYQYHIHHSSPHRQLIFIPYMVFQCSHNIRNQPISATILSPSSFRDITTIRKHQHFSEILNNVFSFVFQDSLAYS